MDDTLRARRGVVLVPNQGGYVVARDDHAIWDYICTVLSKLISEELDRREGGDWNYHSVYYINVPIS